ncbi:MAG: NAD(P)-dependent alcohol dehydrogenase [Myxococcota bacterium]
MKRYTYSSSNGTSVIEGSPIRLVQTEEEARPPAPGEIQVAVRANALNFVDLNCFSGILPVDGRIPLLDGAGEVIATGEGVHRLEVGDRVVANPHASWLSGTPRPESVGEVLGITTHGMLSEIVTLPESVMVPIPESLSFEAAASLPCAGLSAWNSLLGGPSKYGVAPGSTILTLGTGGVSLFAVQFARAMGIRVIATTSSAAKAETLKALGAETVINYVENPDWAAHVIDATDGLGVDLVVEVGGPNTLPQSIASSKAGGRIAMVGIVGGLGSIDYLSMLPINHKVLTLFANGMGSRADLEDMLRFVDANQIAPVIDSSFSFERAGEAITHFAARRHVGKVVISTSA